jgi:predicted nucleotidyltransferase
MNLDDMIAEKEAELSRICERRSVKSLELFGSAARDEAGLESDLDFMVEFKELPFGQMADAFFGLQEDLENLFGRRVDLVEEKAVTNPYFLRNIEKSRRLLYAA